MTAILFNQISAARLSAFEALTAVQEGAYASDTLLAITAKLESRDAGLASQIVFGCLRFQAQLDYLVTVYSRRAASQVEIPVLIALRMALFQLRYLDRVPAHAAVNETVELVKRVRKSAGGFANAVLRKVNRNPIRWPDLPTDVSCPAWLLQRWQNHFGAAEAAAMARAALVEPERYLRIRPGSTLPMEAEVSPTQVEGCWVLHSPLMPGMRLQDIGSQAVLPLLDLRPGQTYLDLCAAPGNKTMQALETPLAMAIACDSSENRLRQMPLVCSRVVLDATQPLPFTRQFDRIFIDAPCSGTGTLARNPEIKWRLKETDLQRFQQKQVKILSEALRHLAAGGRLLYATCSLEPEENESVVERVLEKDHRWRQVDSLRRLPGRDPGDGFYAVALSSRMIIS